MVRAFSAGGVQRGRVSWGVPQANMGDAFGVPASTLPACRSGTLPACRSA